MQKEQQINYTYFAPWIIAGLMIFVSVLALTVFSQQSLRLDEAQSLWQTSHTPSKILNIIAQDVHVPFYHFILHFWQLFLGNSVGAGRALSYIFFILSIPAIYALGTRAFNKSIALFATILFSISPFMNWYGTEIRMYSLFTLLTILSQYFYLGIFKTKEYESSESWVGYFVVNLFGIFTHYFFWLVLMVQALFYIAYRDQFPRGSFRKFVITAVVLALIFSPWLGYVKYLDKVGNSSPLLLAPTTVNVFNTFSQFIFGFQNDHLNTILVSLWPLTVLLGFLALRENERVSPTAIYMLMSIIVPIASAFVLSITILPIFVSRYLILTIPSMYLFISWVFSTYPAGLRKTLQAVLIVAMLAGLVVEIINPTAPVKEDYRAAAEYLQTNAKPQDVIVLSAPFTVYPVEYYYRGATEIQTFPIWNRFANGPIPPFTEDKLTTDTNTIKDTHEKAWVLLSYDQGYEEKFRIYMDTHYERIDEKQFSSGLRLFVYKLRYDEPVFGTQTQ
jgi:mannosyltransferase